MPTWRRCHLLAEEEHRRQGEGDAHDARRRQPLVEEGGGFPPST